MTPTFLRLTRQLLFGFALAAAGGAALAQAPAPALGTDYQRIDPPQPKETQGKIEVVEFFGYWCPHCNAFDPDLTAWRNKQPADVVMRYIPVAFDDHEIALQRLFYTLDTMGKERDLRSKVFAAIHIDHRPMWTADNVADWAAANGIDRAKFLDLYNSFTVATKLRQGDQMIKAYGVTEVPFLAVDGKYSVENNKNAFATLDYLIGQERKTLSGKK